MFLANTCKLKTAVNVKSMRCFGRRILSSVIIAVVLGASPLAADTLVIYGASGNIGSKIVAEALKRGHDVIGVSRNPASLNVQHPKFTVVKGDVTNVESMLGIIIGSDAVVMSVRGNGSDNSAAQTMTNRASLTFIEAAEQLGDGAPRVLQVGNQATLYQNGALGLNSGKYDKDSARNGRVWAHALALDNYRAVPKLKWTVLSPSGSIKPGERTGKYRLGGDAMLLNDEGEISNISEEDFAVAFIDEIEKPQAVGKRVAVGY